MNAMGLAGASKWGLIAAGAGGVSKPLAEALGVRVIMQPGSSGSTSILRVASVLSGGALQPVAAFAKKWAGPIAIASAVIDATAIGICTASD